MTIKMLVVMALLSQCVLISYLIPRKRLARLRHLLAAYPPATHPRLYPKPVAVYERAQRAYRLANGLVLLAGLALAVWLTTLSDAPDWIEMALTGFYLAQMAPLVLLDRASYGFSELSRTEPGTRRTAELRPRRLRDFVSPGLLWGAVAAYGGFLGLCGYVSTLGLDWFSAGANISLITLGNLFMVAVAAWSVRRRKVNPYQASEDRDRQLMFVVRTMALTSIAVSVFVCGSITLSAFELRHFQPVALSVYLQLLAFICLTPPEQRNFEVYREAPAVS